MKRFILGLLLISILSIGMTGAINYDVSRLFTGKQMIPIGAPWIADNQKMYFGTDKDSYIQYNTSLGTSVISGITALVTTGATIASGEDITFVGGDSKFDAHLGSGIFKTTTGAVTIGPGATSLTGATTIANLAAITAGSGSAAYDLSASTGAFTTPTGTNTISGSTVFAANKGVTVASGTSAFDFSGGNGVFKTSTGAVTIGSGATNLTGITTITNLTSIIAATGSSKFDLSGSSGIFKTPTGAITLGGVTIISNLTAITAGSGSSNYDLSASTGGFITSTGTNTMSGNVVVGANKSVSMTAGTGSMDLSSGTGAFKTTGGAVTLGPGNIGLAGSMLIAANKDISAASTGTDVDLSASTDGTFKTGGGANTIGPGANYLTGDTTISSGKTLAVTSVDKLTVGGVIVPQAITIPVIMDADTTANGTIFIPISGNYQVIGVSEVHSVAATPLPKPGLTLVKLTGTQNPATQGTLIMSNKLDLGGAASTIQTGTLHINSGTCKVNTTERLGIRLDNPVTGLAGGCLSVSLKRIA